jgi:hypothetical protein
MRINHYAALAAALGFYTVGSIWTIPALNNAGVPGALAWAMVAIVPAFLVVDYIGRATSRNNPRAREAQIATAKALLHLGWILAIGAGFLVSAAGGQSVLISIVVGAMHGVAMWFALMTLPADVVEAVIWEQA